MQNLHKYGILYVMKEYQLSLFQDVHLSGDALDDVTSGKPLAIDVASPCHDSVDKVYLRPVSESAGDQGWGWQPPEVPVEATLEHEAQLDKNPTEQPPDTWQPPTEAEKERIRFMIEAAKARLRQKRQ